MQHTDHDTNNPQPEPDFANMTRAQALAWAEEPGIAVLEAVRRLWIVDAIFDDEE